MLKKVVITNHLGESMEYRIDGVEVDNPSGLIITSIDGLGPVKANINMSDLATTDGQLYNSARLSGRNIVIKALFTHATSIEEARLLSYKYFPIKKKIKFRIETDNRIAETEGYVESNEPDIFSEESGCQISILCENPYFDGGKIGYTFGDTIPLFKFAFGNESLDEPLIKLSEEAEVTDERRIVYDGDTDTGVEMKFELPTPTDILDSFKVTKIEVTKDGNKTMGLDMSKMSNLVPNTAPTNLEWPKCAFVMDANGRYKFLKEIPWRANNSTTVIYKDQIMLIDYYNKIMIWDGTDYIPSEIPVFSDDHIAYAQVLHNRLHVFTSSVINLTVRPQFYKHYVLNEENNSWDQIGNTWDGSDFGASCVVFNDEIHIIGGAYHNPSGQTIKRRTHYKWGENDTDMVLVETLPEDSLIGLVSAGHTVYDNAIHIISGETYNQGNSRYHFKWDRNEWSRVTEFPSQLVRTNISAVVLNNSLHAFSHIYHCEWDGVEDLDLPHWRLISTLPYANNSHAIEFNNYVYLFSSDTTSYSGDWYTEEPNNVKLIENDRLVINTNKGKKSITLYRDDNKYNVINSLEKGSTWLQLHRGVNRISYSAETGADDMEITISTNKWYEGV